MAHSCSNIIFCGTFLLLSLLMKRIFLARCHILKAKDLEAGFLECILPPPCSDASNLTGQIRHRCTNYGIRLLVHLSSTMLNQLAKMSNILSATMARYSYKNILLTVNTEVPIKNSLTHWHKNRLTNSLTHTWLLGKLTNSLIDQLTYSVSNQTEGTPNILPSVIKPKNPNKHDQHIKNLSFRPYPESFNLLTTKTQHRTACQAL
jgi:hypothetical protein